MAEPILRIGQRSYRLVDYGIFKVPVNELENLQIGDLPPHSAILVVGLPEPPEDHEFYLTVTNGGGEGDYDYLNVFGCVTFRSQKDAFRKMERIRRVYLPLVENGELPDAMILSPRPPDRFSNGPSFSLDFAGKPSIVVREAISPMIRLFEKMSFPEVRLFICHASEDKKFAHELASYLINTGAEVWLDQWEIRVGDSIVEKINSALTAASHLVLILSSHSVKKPWVKREFSSALMRQLASNSIKVIPVRIDDCEVPIILSDVRYADCRDSKENGFNEIRRALFP